MLLKPKDKPRRTTKPKTKEKEIQSLVESYLRAKHIKYTRFPDSLYRYIFGIGGVPVHIKAQLAEYMRGVPDLIIYMQSKEYNYTLLLELKTETGKLSQGQKNWGQGLSVAVARSFQEAKTAIDIFLAYVDAKENP
jgi:hypothetical protein